MYCLRLLYTRIFHVNTQQFGSVGPANTKTSTREKARCLPELSR
jgi:hypothetical protein